MKPDLLCKALTRDALALDPLARDALAGILLPAPLLQLPAGPSGATTRRLEIESAGMPVGASSGKIRPEGKLRIESKEFIASG